MIRVKKIYMSVHVEMVDRETQASQWLDHHFLTRYEEQIWEMENELSLIHISSPRDA